MKRTTISKAICLTLIAAVFTACGGGDKKTTEPALSTTEEQAVEERMKKDQQSMDSLEQAIMNQIKSDTTVEIK